MSWVSRLLALLLLLPVSALGQSNPGFVTGNVLTASQLNAAFSSKTDFPVSINVGTGVTGILGIPNGGTGAGVFTVNKPVVGNGTSPFIAGTTTGNTTTFVTSTGAITSGHCVAWDANGNAVDGGVCGGGGGAVSSVFGRTGAVVAAANDYSFSLLSGQATLAQLPTLTANTVLGALTATTPVQLVMPSCSTSSNGLTWSSGTGFGCNTFAGGGSVTSVVSGNFSPLFNVSVATPTTAPTLSFAAISQSANLVYAGPSSGSAVAPTFRALTATDMPPGFGAGGTNGQTLFNNAGAIGGYTMSQDCTITTAGVITCTKTNNVAFANSATIDTTNATNISSGTLALARLPANMTQTIGSGTAALGTGAIGSAACATAVTVASASVLATDTLTVSFNGDPTGVTGYIPATTGMLTIIPYPTAGNVNFKVCNNTGASITPGAITLNWRVVR